ncbi:unnamed protein product [Musa acuminata subsp. malaccensis]|uniref:(wild Malaysian banana) hypothetical protein n=1 Tax=Musa acuminata subsp. malaccensis TaxID=214687 RepID=A0A804JP35_MUSAM|nr:PREDICTED: uncharacterized protein LOC103990206 [Musa acuminata subsp. malaccensis]CAG1848383.1 unnamed protein product [Musa acuminata subsp. malaccensis]
MEVQVTGACSPLSHLSPTNSLTAFQVAFGLPFGSSKRKGAAARGCDCVLTPPVLGAPSPRLSRARSLEILWGRGRRAQEQALRRAFSVDRFASDGDDDEVEEEEFVQRFEELPLELRQHQRDGNEDSVVACSESWSSQEGVALPTSACFSSDTSPVTFPLPLSRKQQPSTERPWLPFRPEPPDWSDQIVPASVEMNANSVELPLSLRIIKRKKQCEDRWFREAGGTACCSVKRAFSSMVFMIRELQSYTLQMREVLFREDLQGILARVQREMNSSFVWLFQQIFSCTPTLMLSVMLLLANFTVYSMDNLDGAAATATPKPPTQQSLFETVMVEDHRQSHHERYLVVKTISSILGGSGVGGGGKTRPVAGATGDGRSDDKSSSDQTILPDSVSKAPGALNAEEGGERGKGEGASATAPSRAEEEVSRAWKGILEEVSRMQASTRDAALMDPATLRLFVSPVAVELEHDDYSEYLRTEFMYQQALSQDPDNALLLANFAQFLYLVRHDHDRAEYYFKRAAKSVPADAEALSRYATFLWLSRKDLEAAEETYLEAIDADPGNTFHAANYAHFLWNTGGEDTCYPLDDGNGDDDAF